MQGMAVEGHASPKITADFGAAVQVMKFGFQAGSTFSQNTRGAAAAFPAGSAAAQQALEPLPAICYVPVPLRLQASVICLKTLFSKNVVGTVSPTCRSERLPFSGNGPNDRPSIRCRSLRRASRQPY
jgi:hypothetical protein